MSDAAPARPDGSYAQDLFANAFARYLSVRPTGIQMPYGPIVPSLCARLLTCHPARTLYQHHQPICRSLDGSHALAEDRACAACLQRPTCTPQIYLELLHDHVPYRLLLAYRSARNFMLFASRLRQQGQPIENAEVILAVRDRGRWGELHFIRPPPPLPA